MTGREGGSKRRLNDYNGDMTIGGTGLKRSTANYVYIYILNTRLSREQWTESSVHFGCTEDL